MPGMFFETGGDEQHEYMLMALGQTNHTAVACDVFSKGVRVGIIHGIVGLDWVLASRWSVIQADVTSPISPKYRLIHEPYRKVRPMPVDKGC